MQISFFQDLTNFILFIYLLKLIKGFIYFFHVGSQFPDQGWNPYPRIESMES